MQGHYRKLCVETRTVSSRHNPWLALLPPQVQEEASKLDPSLSVSSMLLLSSPGLQDQYYTWMDRTPAVTWHPYFLPFFHVIVGQRILNRAEDGCTGFALIVSLPCTLLASVRVAMECSGAPKQLQSIASLVALAYFVTVFTGMMALHDPCTLSIGPDWTISPAGNAVYVALVAAVQIALTPCVMQHLAALCVITSSLDLFLACFIWSQQRHGGLGLSSYPTHYVELGIIIAAARTATLLVGAAVRYRLAHGNMKAFLRSARRPHRH